MKPNTCRVLLVHSVPAADNSSDPDFRIAPVGLFFLAGALKENGHETLTLSLCSSAFAEDSQTSIECRKNIQEQIQQFDPDLIGYSFRNLYLFGQPAATSSSLKDYFSAPQDLPVINSIRSVTQAPIIGGGSAFSLAPQFYMNYLNLDYGVVGEGENVLVQLINALHMNHPVDAIPSLVYRNGNQFIVNPIHYDQELATRPDLASLRQYKSLYYDQGGYGAIQTKRGCAFRCSYCIYPYLEGTRYRLRPVEEILSEIEEYLFQHQIRHIYFVDSVFSTPADHSVSLTEKLIERSIDINWYAYVNPMDLSFNALQNYKKSGCNGLVLTIDSGSDTILRNLRKGFTRDQSIQAIQYLKQLEMPFEVSMIVGTPGDSRETLTETLLFCKEYLNSIPTVFTPGVWMHPMSQMYADYHGSAPDDSDTLSRFVLEDDFGSHNALHYFFSDQKDRPELIHLLHTILDRRPEWFLLGKDIIPDATTGIMQYPKIQGMKRYCRPWFSGLGSGELNE